MATIHEADLEPGLSGAVLRGPEIDLASAVARRAGGGNVVVCGTDLKENRNLARQVEAAVGPYQQAPPHVKAAGPLALPHFEQLDEDNEGHTFYETPNRHSRKNP